MSVYDGTHVPPNVTFDNTVYVQIVEYSRQISQVTLNSATALRGFASLQYCLSHYRSCREAMFGQNCLSMLKRRPYSSFFLDGFYVHKSKIIVSKISSEILVYSRQKLSQII
jgi:hypothetical protein